MIFSRRQFLAASTTSLLAYVGPLRAQNQQTGGILKRTIPASGEPLPVIGLGTLEAFDVAGTLEEREALGEVLKALSSHGGTLVDTSPRYGRAEAMIGDICKEQGLTENLFFATKVFSVGEQAGMDEMNESMDRLHVPQIDLMQVHSMREWETHLPSIRKFREQGKIRYAGITIHRDSGHEQMMTLMRNENLDFIQVNYNLIERGAADKVLPLAQELGVAVVVNVPFAKAELFKKTSGLDLPEWASEFDCQSWAQFFLKYVISHPTVTCVIPRTSKPHHMVDNVTAGFGAMPDAKTRLRMEAFIDNL